MSYPDDTILANFTAEIYASQTTGEITILHDKQFKEVLQALEYHEQQKELIFVFKNSRMSYGETLKEVLWPFFSRAYRAYVILYDKQKKSAISGISVPLNVKQPKVKIFN